MKKRFQLLTGTFSVATLFSSCSATHRIGKETASWMTTTSSKVAHFSEVAADRIRPQTIKVVEVREQDLKELPSGREQALAFERTRKANFWLSKGPVNFDVPRLPEIGNEMDGSLLPPRQP